MAAARPGMTCEASMLHFCRVHLPLAGGRQTQTCTTASPRACPAPPPAAAPMARRARALPRRPAPSRSCLQSPRMRLWSRTRSGQTPRLVRIAQLPVRRAVLHALLHHQRCHYTLDCMACKACCVVCSRCSLHLILVGQKTTSLPPHACMRLQVWTMQGVRDKYIALGLCRAAGTPRASGVRTQHRQHVLRQRPHASRQRGAAAGAPSALFNAHAFTCSTCQSALVSR